MKYKVIVFAFLNSIGISVSAQRIENVDSVFVRFIQSDFFHQKTDTLPSLFLIDSTMLEADDLKSIQSIFHNHLNIPLNIHFKKWKLIEWPSIPPYANNSSVSIFSTKLPFNRYKIRISIPVVNPDGKALQPGECCEDTHYIIGATITIWQRKKSMKILKYSEFFYLNWSCVLWA